MPELPDVTVYVDALAKRIVGQELTAIRLKSPFVLRSVEPPVAATLGRKVTSVSRLGKRIVMVLEGDLFLVIHLMVAGRLQWKANAKAAGKIGLGTFEFPTGTLVFTEAGTKHRASLHIVGDPDGLAAFDRGGLEVQGASLKEFRTALTEENHTLKRALTDPTILSGIGNAYSDEILHRAKLSPIKLTDRLEDDEMKRLFQAVKAVLNEWTARLRKQVGDKWPTKVTAFHEEMAVHGKFGKPCPVCATPVQRIAYADNETNYCPTCQTDGKLLADRSLSKLLRGDWPKTLAELEERKRRLKSEGS